MSDLSKRSADNIRVLSVAMVEKAASGHPGGAMGGADFIHVLFSEFLRFDPLRPDWHLRDRFFLDPGHMSPMLYSQLALCGFFTMDELKNFRQWGSPTPGHPELDRERMIENTSGPLGQGHTMAVGSAIAERFTAARFGEITAHKTFAFISDGGIQEEIAQGAGRIAGHLGLNNLILFYDANQVQLSTKVNEVTSEDTAAKYRAWGWQVYTINGNDHDEIRAALTSAIAEKDKPVLIIGNTVMGKGLLDSNGSSMEGRSSTHGQPVSKAGASPEVTYKSLGADPSEPFMIYPDVADYYKALLEKKHQDALLREKSFEEWGVMNQDLLAKYRTWHEKKTFSTEMISEFTQKSNNATRAASADFLTWCSQNIDNMIVASADLSNSDKTDGFLKHKKPFTKGDFSGGFLNAGVAELTMASIANGMALHGGVIPVCGTFFVFSDYMKPAVRLSALMQLQVIYVWTHDAFRVGEDGPTHQPIEHEAQIRLMEHLRNHSGERSMRVFRPADADETTVAWSLALQNLDSPTGLILSRQNIKSLPGFEGLSRASSALEASKGAYIVMDDEQPLDLVLFASGSEVATLVGAAEILKKKRSVNLRVVSVMSEGLFRDQSEEYQSEVFPVAVPRFGLTSGLPVTLAGLAGSNGLVAGLDHFGYSAPAEILDEKFGFTSENIAVELEAFLTR